MPISQAQKTQLEELASSLEAQVGALVVDPDTPTGPTQAELDAALAQRDAAIAERDAALAQTIDLQQKIDAAKAQLRAAADADAIEDAGRAGALSALGD